MEAFIEPSAKFFKTTIRLLWVPNIEEDVEQHMNMVGNEFIGKMYTVLASYSLIQANDVTLWV